MNDLSIAAGRWLLHTALGGGVLLLMVCLVMRWTRQPAKKQRLGEGGMAAALLLALLCLPGRPWLVVSWTGPAAEPQTAAEPARPAPDVDDIDGGKSPRAVLEMLLPGAELEIPATPTNSVIGPLETRTEPGIDWLAIAATSVLGLFAVTASALTLRMILGYVGLFRLLQCSQTAPQAIRSLFDSMAGDAPWARLLVSQRLAVPLSCGLVRPTVLLPSSLCHQPAFAKLRWIFAHELTHLRRLDAWSGLLFAVGQVLFFYLPWFWWLRRQVRLCQEFVADAVATQQEGQAVQYAEFLVSLVNAPATPAAATGVGGQPSDLYRRVSMLLERPVAVETRCSRRWTFCVAVGLAVVAILAGGVGYRAEAGPDDTIVIVISPGTGTAKSSQKTNVQVITSDQIRPAKAKQAPTAKGQMRWEELFDEETALLFYLGGNQGRDLSIPLGDDFTPLREALKRLEGLKKQGKLTQEVIRDEVNKALKEMEGKGTTGDAQKKKVLLELEMDVQQADAAKQKKKLLLDDLAEKLFLDLSGGDYPKLKELTAENKYLGDYLKDQKSTSVLEDPLQEPSYVERLKDVERRLEAAKEALEDWKERANWSLRMYKKGLMSQVQADADAARADVARISLDKLMIEKRVLDEQQKKNEPKADPRSKAFRDEIEAIQQYLKADQKTFAALEALQHYLKEDQKTNEPKANQTSPKPRLGVSVIPVPETLAEHLGLAKNFGMVVVEVYPDTPAAKIGLKVQDILIKIDGAMIPSDADDFLKLIVGLKSNTPFDVVVIRKGQEMNLGKVKLAGAEVGSPEESKIWADQEAAIENRLKVMESRNQAKARQLKRAQDELLEMTKQAKNKTPPGDGEKLDATVVAKQSVKGAELTVTGTLEKGAFVLAEIEIQIGKTTTKYKKVEEVPEAYRPTVDRLVERLSKQPTITITGPPPILRDGLNPQPMNKSTPKSEPK